MVAGVGGGGKWYVDYQDLSTCAIGVRAREGTWEIPARRGNNVVVPGRDGAIFTADKPLEEGSFSLDMFAVGANPDGSVPVGGDRRIMVRENLDRMARLFGSGQLLDLAYVEDSTSPYGRQNLLPNPSFETSTASEVVRENVLQNPSGEYTSGLSSIRRNHVPNPGMDKGSASTPNRTNMVPNPRMESEGTATAYRTNLIANPSFEVNTNQWAVQGTAVLKRVAKVVAGIWPPSDGGQYCLRVTAAGAGNQTVVGGPATVVAGTTYTGSAYVLNDDTAARDFKIVIQWRDRKGNVLTTSTGGTLNVAAGGVGRPFVTAAAPATATQAYMRLVYVAGTAGKFAYWDNVLLEASGSLGTYFDGSSDENDGYRHAWNGNSGVSTSREFGVAPFGYTSARRLFMSDADAMAGLHSAKVICTTSAATGTLLFGQTARDGCNIGTRQLMAGLVNVKPKPGSTLSVSVRLACYDSGGAYLGPLKASPAGSNLADVTSALEDGAWTAIEYGGGYVQTGTTRVAIEVRSSGTWAQDDYGYFDAFMVEPVANASDYFDGSTPPLEQYGFKWVGTPQRSESQRISQTVDSWTVLGGPQIQAPDGYLGDRCLHVDYDGNGIPIEIRATVLDLTKGRTHMFSVYARPNRTQNVTARITIDGTATTGSAVSCTAGQWTRVTVSANVPSTASVVVVSAFGAAPSALDAIDFDAALFEAASTARTYFDGNSGDSFGWAGAEGASVSLWKQYAADGWSPWGDVSQPSIWRTDERKSNRSYSIEAQAKYAGDFGVTSGRDNVKSGSTYTFGVDVSIAVNRTVRVGLRWADAQGTYLSESVTNTAVTSGTGFTRLSVTASPPVNAVVVSPYVAVIGASADEVLYVDAAVFGFGGTSTYADGYTSGWSWTDTPDYSESKQLAAAVDAWYETVALTLSRSALWSSDRSNSALAVVVSTTQPHEVWGYAQNWSDVNSVLEQYFVNDPDRSVTFALDVRGREAGQARVSIVPYTWDGWAMNPSTDPVVQGSKIAYGAGVTVRPKITGDFTEATTHFLVKVEFFNTSGAAAALNQGQYIDKAIAGYGSWDGAYFDGESDGADWSGAKDYSWSRFYGEARAAKVECRDAVDFSSFGSGTGARFVAKMRAPEPFFTDQVATKVILAAGRSGVVYSLYDLGGGTARITDALIQIFGPIENPRLTDISSGAWLQVNLNIPVNRWITIDCAEWTVENFQGTSVITNITHGGSAVLLPVSPIPNEFAPKLRLESSSVGDGARIEVTAKRKYHVA